ncbi:unannotated protein [freshwater metagenome]|uniref:Unannotated protein n=1 Tax=freshwater metagenome TaxID=449393 RepID=A0A6J6J0K6_9ZZZZ|nr:hypothetical protein [Actinomycetota bacterium]
MNWYWFVVVAFLIAVFGWYLSSTAGRLDRLHRRIETATFALDSQLLRRSSIAIELSVAGVLDPASSEILAETAHDARLATDAAMAVRIPIESSLSEVLIQALDDPDEVGLLRQDKLAADLIDELESAIRRVELSRQFLNDAVEACLRIRDNKLVNWFRLAGHTPLPQAWVMVDRMPEGLMYLGA